VPVLVIHGDADRICPFERGARVAELTGGQFVALEGAGHAPQARDPVAVNRLIREFADIVWGRERATAGWVRGRARPPFAFPI
jgi:pimeloyl-ACP methyl ester carboxylesterase